MRRADRLELLLEALRDRPGVTAGELAVRVGTTIRSVFRDLALLRERGYPIESSRGRGGGLRLHPNWGLGRVMLSPEEALGALLSLAVAEGLALPMFGRDLRAARLKLVAAFPAAERQRLQSLRRRVLVGAAASSQVRESYSAPDSRTSLALQSAFVKEVVVRLDYERGDGGRSVREVEPHALLLNWPAWYLIGFDHTRDAARTFRLDRVRGVTPTSRRFRAAPHRIVEAIGGLDYADPARFSL